MTPNVAYIDEGGFFAHNGGPRVDAPEDWIAWHFTLPAYIPEIIQSGQLLCDESVPPRRGSVANPDVKALRRGREVAAPGYPTGRRVSQHVPFYIAAKSPMLYVVSKNQPRTVVDSLVFFGVRLGDLIDLGLEWVASNGNAATALTQFSADIDTLGTFVDFDLLRERAWANTPDDQDRKSRRSAEILVHGGVPMEAVSVVAATNAAALDHAYALLHPAGYEQIEYFETPTLRY